MNETTVGINFFNESIPFVLRNKSLVRKWVTDTINSNKKLPGAINFIFCDDNYLLELNKSYLGHTTLTDIITFDYTHEKYVSGDVFISIQRVKENAKTLNIKFKDEIHRVMIHGVLHLCGFGDKSPKEKSTMIKQENKYLSLRTF